MRTLDQNLNLLYRLARHIVNKHQVYPNELVAIFEDHVRQEAHDTWWGDENLNKEICKQADYEILTYGHKYFAGQDPTLLLDLNIHIGLLKKAITITEEFASRHKWRAAMGSFVLFCRHMCNRREYPENPFPLCCFHCLSAEQREVLTAANLTDNEFLALERLVAMSDTPLYDVQAWINHVRDEIQTRYQRTVETRARNKALKESKWKKNLVAKDNVRLLRPPEKKEEANATLQPKQ